MHDKPVLRCKPLRREPEYAQVVIRATLAEGGVSGVAAVADKVQLRLAKRVTDCFLSLYDKSEGRVGYVSIQGSPLADHDASLILERAHAARQVAPNVAVKVPATIPGLHALEELVGLGATCIVTEVFSLGQLVEACTCYLRATSQTNHCPPFFVSPITGILGDHLRKVAAREGIEVDPRALELAGVAFARRCYSVVRDKPCPVTLLFGGARTVDDFVGLVGGPTASTINYSTVAEILALDPPALVTINQPIPEYLLNELNKFSDFRLALSLDPLRAEDFEEFGPVQHFRDTFVTAWKALLEAIEVAAR